MKRLIPITTACLSALLMTSCASYQIRPIARDDNAWPACSDDVKNGYVIYEPELYFAASIETEAPADSKQPATKSINVTPLYLPNYKKAYRVTTKNFLAKADYTFEFENGWKLTKLSDKSDNSTLANTMAGQLKTILSAAGVGVMAVTGEVRVILYRPVYGNKTGLVESFEEVSGFIETQPNKNNQ